MRLLLSAALAGVLLAAPARAGVEFVLTDGERELDGGEVCFWKTAVSPGNVSPDKYFFSDDEVRCYPAKTILDMDARRLLLFARHSDGYVSANRQMRYDAEPTKEECYQKIAIRVVPSARIDLPPQREGTRLGVWVSDTDQTLGTFLPAIAGESSMLVPAGIRIIPLAIERTRVARAGKPVILAAGERFALPPFSSTTGRGDVVAWLEGDDAAARSHRNLGDASIALKLANGDAFEPVAAPRHPGSYNGTLVIFTGVPAGKATLTSGGRFWTHDAVSVDVPAGGTVTAAKPLRVKPAGAVRAMLPPVIDGTLTTGTCDTGPRPKFAMALRSCESCEALRETEVADPRDGVAIEGVAPGKYTLALTMPHGRTFTRNVELAIAEEQRVSFDEVGVLVYGTVRRGTTPVRAEVGFATDDTAVSDVTGAYRALLKANPGQHVVSVTACGGATFMHLPEHPPAPYEPFDIEIPDNTLIAAVRDGITGAGIAAARVRYAVLKDPDDDNEESFSILYSQSADADRNGEAAFSGVAPRKTIRVCAEASGYRAACSKRAVTPRTGEGRVEVQLAPEAARRGRIAASRRVEGARIFLLDASGRIVSDSVVQDDGTFLYTAAATGGHAILIAPALPLTVVPVTIANGELLIAVPEAAARRFRVTVSSGRSARIGLMVGDVIVPPSVFLLHQNFRGLQSVLLPGAALEVAEIAESAPIVVVLGPELTDTTLPADAVGRREYVRAFRSRLLAAGMSLVAFD